MKTTTTKRKFSLLLVGGIAGCALLGAGAGSAFAQIPTLLAPAGLHASDGTSTPAPAPTYSRNASGLTYGSATKAVSPSTEPDLIQAVASNGKSGYVKKSELTDAEGPTDFASPADALTWQSANAGKDVSVTVYGIDGKTPIGQFVIHYPTSVETQEAQSSTR